MDKQQQHAPEPWRVESTIVEEPSPANYDCWAATTFDAATGLTSARFLIPQEWAMSEANARRIVACVNFCAGKTNAELAALGSLLAVIQKHNDFVEGHIQPK